MAKGNLIKRFSKICAMCKQRSSCKCYIGEHRIIIPICDECDNELERLYG